VLIAALLAAGPSGAPPATKTRERRVPDAYRQGVARYGSGWIFSGTAGLWRTDDDLRTRAANPSAIPADLRARGYRSLGDIDVAGVYVYAALEQPDARRNEQVVARFHADTLEFVDGVTLSQHENPFVAVDARSGTAFTIDRRASDELLRYDLGGLRWRPLPPVTLDRRVENVEGVDLGEGYAYLSTAGSNRSLYRVDLGSGEVVRLGEDGATGAGGEGIDVTPLGDGRVHTLTSGRDERSVFLTDYDVAPARKTGRAEQLIIAATVVATLGATVAVIVVTRRRAESRRTAGP
jgi:hypothetical protein